MILCVTLVHCVGSCPIRDDQRASGSSNDVLLRVRGCPSAATYSVAPGRESGAFLQDHWMVATWLPLIGGAMALVVGTKPPGKCYVSLTEEAAAGAFLLL